MTMASTPMAMAMTECSCWTSSGGGDAGGGGEHAEPAADRPRLPLVDLDAGSGVADGDASGSRYGWADWLMIPPADALIN